MVKRPAVNREIVGSNPTMPAKYLGVAQSVKSAWFGTRRPKVQILPPRPICGEHSLMAKRLIVTQVDTGSSPVAHPTVWKTARSQMVYGTGLLIRRL